MTRHTWTGKGAMRRSTSLYTLVLALLGGAWGCDKGAVEPTGIPAASNEPGNSDPAGGPVPSTPTTSPEPFGSEHVYLAKADGTVIGPLVSGRSPVWSPDGKQVAFNSDYGIHVINADGSNNTLVGPGAHPSWSPDGKKLVFSNRDGISIMNADGSGVRTIVPHDFNPNTYKPWDMGAGNPAWSPDGRRIAFLHLGDGDMKPAQAYVVNTDGSNLRLLSPTIDGGRYAESDPSWSPDGSKIVYWMYRFGISIINADAGFPTPIYSAYPSVAYGARPSWSPDGSTIVFNYRGFPGASPGLWIMSASGRGARLLIPNAYDAAWSPDGARIAFVSTR